MRYKSKKNNAASGSSHRDIQFPCFGRAWSPWRVRAEQANGKGQRQEDHREYRQDRYTLSLGDSLSVPYHASESIVGCY